jgi:hypothetical protein
VATNAPKSEVNVPRARLGAQPVLKRFSAVPKGKISMSLLILLDRAFGLQAIARGSQIESFVHEFLL